MNRTDSDYENECDHEWLECELDMGCTCRCDLCQSPEIAEIER